MCFLLSLKHTCPSSLQASADTMSLCGNGHCPPYLKNFLPSFKVYFFCADFHHYAQPKMTSALPSAAWGHCHDVSTSPTYSARTARVRVLPVPCLPCCSPIYSVNQICTARLPALTLISCVSANGSLNHSDPQCFHLEKWKQYKTIS